METWTRTQTYVYKDLEVKVAVYILESLQNTTKCYLEQLVMRLENRTTYLSY